MKQITKAGTFTVFAGLTHTISSLPKLPQKLSWYIGRQSWKDKFSKYQRFVLYE